MHYDLQFTIFISNRILIINNQEYKSS